MRLVDNSNATALELYLGKGKMTHLSITWRPVRESNSRLIRDRDQ